MEERAIAMIRNIGYTGVGTLEFLLDAEGNYYFMEMNIRLQVEHGVTEILTGIDLVKWQIRVAAGVDLDFSKEDIRLLGSAIECRINAKNAGKVTAIHVPGGPFVRFDTYLEQGTDVPPFYDSLLAKLIVYAKRKAENISERGSPRRGSSAAFRRGGAFPAGNGEIGRCTTDVEEPVLPAFHQLLSATNRSNHDRYSPICRLPFKQTK
ncbi:MAG: hypothetical protein ACOX6K_02320 [Sphaerochaetaceae bacterium]|jgi:hypothetical protein